MKTLKQYNEEMKKFYDDCNIYNRFSCKNGIECPKCKSELCDKNPHKILLSNPPKKEIICYECGYEDIVIVKG